MEDSHMDVVGYDLQGYPIVRGDLMGGGGDLMGVGQGYYGGYGQPGYGVYGAPAPQQGRHARHRGREMQLPPRPQWRNQLAPGVIQPDEGLVPMALAGTAGSPPGTFTATLPSIIFSGQLQKPFRGERLLVSTVRTGTSSTGRLLGQLFVGTDLQGGDITSWDIELVGQAQSFGTRLTTKQAEPGVLIRLIVTLSNPLAGTDSIFASVQILGRIVH